MNIVMFYHSLASCWNHGNAHFLRGIVRELVACGHDVTLYEPADGWSRSNAIADGGFDALAEAETLVAGVRTRRYTPDTLAIDDATADADAVLVHEWNEPALIGAVGALRKAGAPWTLLFHDTHHRAVTAPHEIDRFDLSGYDAVLAFGEAGDDAGLLGVDGAGGAEFSVDGECGGDVEGGLVLDECRFENAADALALPIHTGAPCRS